MIFCLYSTSFYRGVVFLFFVPIFLEKREQNCGYNEKPLLHPGSDNRTSRRVCMTARLLHPQNRDSIPLLGVCSQSSSQRTF